MQMEFREATQTFSELVSNIKTILQLRLTMLLKGHKKCMCSFRSTKSPRKGSVGPLPCDTDDLVEN